MPEIKFKVTVERIETVETTKGGDWRVVSGEGATAKYDYTPVVPGGEKQITEKVFEQTVSVGGFNLAKIIAAINGLDVPDPKIVDRDLAGDRL